MHWVRLVYINASLAMIIGDVANLSFLIAGAGVLAPMKLAPDNEYHAPELSNIFSVRWGKIGVLPIFVFTRFLKSFYH